MANDAYMHGRVVWRSVLMLGFFSRSCLVDSLRTRIFFDLRLRAQDDEYQSRKEQIEVKYART